MDHIKILSTGKKTKSHNKSFNGDDKCFQQAATVALNYEEIGKKLTKNMKN